MIQSRLNDEQLNMFIKTAIEHANIWTDDCIKSTAYSNVALIEIYLRLLDKH